MSNGSKDNGYDELYLGLQIGSLPVRPLDVNRPSFRSILLDRKGIYSMERNHNLLLVMQFVSAKFIKVIQILVTGALES